MSGPSATTPILPLPHRIRGAGSVVLRGSGELSVQLDGTGQAVVLRRGVATLSFAGTAARRLAPGGETVFASAMGTLSVRGAGLEVRIERARVSVDVVGLFHATLEGRGEIEPAHGPRRPWGARGSVYRIEGSGVRLLPEGGAAA